MSAVSNITYVWFQDVTPGSPEKDTSPVPFANYNEAMSYAKWSSIHYSVNQVRAYIWNYNGGSGYWNNGVFNSIANTNWP
jgi:hypothetical protein